MNNFPKKLLIYSIFLVININALSLDDAISTALSNSTDIKKQKLNIDFANSDIKEKKSSDYGHVDVLASYTHYNLPRTLTPLTPSSLGGISTVIPTSKDIFTTGVTYSVELFNGMQNTRSIEISSLQKEIAQSTVTLSKEQLVYNIKTLYVNILALQKQEKAQITYVDALKKLYSDIKYKVELGRLAKIDALKSLAELEKASTTLAEIQSNIEIMKETLASAMFVDGISELEDIKIDVVDIVKNEAIYNKTLEQTQRMKLALLNTQKNLKQEQKALSAYYPKIGLNGFYGQNFGPNDSSNKNSGNWESSEVWQAGVELKWNIFDFGKKSSLVQKSRIATLQSKLEKSKIKRELKRSLTEALSKITLSIKSFKSAKSELELMKETQKIERIRYDNGASDINDLLYTKARYQLSLSRYINSKYSYQNSINYLNYILEKGNEK